MSWYDDNADAALLARGWERLDSQRGPDGDMWHRPPSQHEHDEETQTYYEPTCIHPRDGDLYVDLATPPDAPHYTQATYATLDDLLADLTAIEDHRLERPTPALPHASAVVARRLRRR